MERLCGLVASSSQLMAALRAVRSLELASWCIGAGVIRSLVWDSLHGYREPSPVADVDVAYFAAGAPVALAVQLQQQLSFLLPGLDWEVTNQAQVHEWLVDASGQAYQPLISLEDGLATWPEFATCVGVYCDAHDSVRVIAPYGLDDLFELRVRHNPRRVDAATFMERVRSKRFIQRWPRLTVCPP